ncbi:MAG: UDP-3-O-(3-hydroxymyristoyl)glucosamine N-acyltransferase [Cetobacterium sp.]
MVEIKNIAELLEGVVIGNESFKISGISTLEWAEEEEIVYALTDKELRNLDQTNSKAIVTRPFFSLGSKKNFIFTEKSKEEILLLVTQALQENNTKVTLERKINKDVKLHKMTILEENVQIGAGTVIGPGTVIENEVIIGKNCKIGANVTIKANTIIGDAVVIDNGVCLGAESFFRIIRGEENKLLSGLKGVEIKSNSFIGANSTIERGIFRRTTIGENNVFGSLTAIGHDTVTGKNCRMVSQSGIAGETTLGNNVTIFAQVGIANRIKIGDDVTIFAKSGVKDNIKSGEIISGIPACNHKENMKSIIKVRREVRCRQGKKT